MSSRSKYLPGCILLLLCGACIDRALSALEEDEATKNLRAYQLADKKYTLILKEKRLFEKIDELGRSVFEMKREIVRLAGAVDQSSQKLEQEKMNLRDVQEELKGF